MVAMPTKPGLGLPSAYQSILSWRIANRRISNRCWHPQRPFKLLKKTLWEGEESAKRRHRACVG